jgi:hypothetical protein
MRVVSLATVALIVVAAFALGRVTAAPRVFAAPPMATMSFSHFECYEAKFQGSVAPTTVELTDQFHQFETAVGAPQLFCTPVTKKVLSGRDLAVPAPANHLTCYGIQGPTIQETRVFANQFLKGEVGVGTPTLLCVPTHKQG